MSVAHRVRLPTGARVLVEVGHRVEPAEVLANRRLAGDGTSLPVAARLRRSPSDAAGLLVARPGTRLEAGEPLASDGRGRQVVVPHACLFLGYDHDDGTALIAPLGEAEPVIGHVRGEVASITSEAIELTVAGAVVAGVGGIGNAVHGELMLAVADPADELRASAIDVSAAGRILVGGSRASAETLTRARTIGASGIVLGGALDKELRDFEATQARHREIGAAHADFAVLVLEGYGKVALDSALFAWFRQHDGRMASLFGAETRLYVYDAGPAPARRVLPRAGDGVVSHRRPFAGATGRLVRVIDGLHASPSGITARSAVVRFEDGQTAIVPLANLEAADPGA
ncbi:MAG TPA: hypothetical protein VI277_08670 [Candidatus Limnocylindria bacterium]